MVRLPKSVLTLIAAGAGAGAIATAYIGEREGLSLAAYQDLAGVWTICRGITEGVQPGQVVTREQCDAAFASEVGKRLTAVYQLAPVQMTPARHAALTSFSYNVGLENFKTSTLRRRLNAGDPDPCDEILRWVYVRKKDCRDPANKCSGIVTRRQEEAALCRM